MFEIPRTWIHVLNSSCTRFVDHEFGFIREENFLNLSKQRKFQFSIRGSVDEGGPWKNCGI